MTNLTEEDVKKMVKESEKKEIPVPETETEGLRQSRERKVLIVGFGDGGAIMSSDVKQAIGIDNIIYNTSTTGIGSLKYSKAIIPNTTDGSGRDRKFSKDTFKQGPAKDVLAVVKEKTDSFVQEDMVVLMTTTSGGTGGGCSTNGAKFIADNITGKDSYGRPQVIILGALPLLSEGKPAQYNTLAWHSEVEKIGLPYIVVDNNHYASQFQSDIDIHDRVNKDVVNVMNLLSGKIYGDTTQSIDNRDLLTMLNGKTKEAKRIFATVSHEKVKMNQLFDDYLLDLISKTSQPEPLNPTFYGIFVKGPESMLKMIDTSIPKIRDKYGDQYVYKHLEVSDEVSIGFIASGCAPAYDRIMKARNRYSEIEDNKVEVVDYMKGLENPLAGSNTTQLKNRKETDTSAFEI